MWFQSLEGPWHLLIPAAHNSWKDHKGSRKNLFCNDKHPMLRNWKESDSDSDIATTLILTQYLRFSSRSTVTQRSHLLLLLPLSNRFRFFFFPWSEYLATNTPHDGPTHATASGRSTHRRHRGTRCCTPCHCLQLRSGQIIHLARHKP